MTFESGADADSVIATGVAGRFERRSAIAAGRDQQILRSSKHAGRRLIGQGDDLSLNL